MEISQILNVSMLEMSHRIWASVPLCTLFNLFCRFFWWAVGGREVKLFLKDLTHKEHSPEWKRNNLKDSLNFLWGCWSEDTWGKPSVSFLLLKPYTLLTYGRVFSSTPSIFHEKMFASNNARDCLLTLCPKTLMRSVYVWVASVTLGSAVSRRAL